MTTKIELDTLLRGTTLVTNNERLQNNITTPKLTHFLSVQEPYTEKHNKKIKIKIKIISISFKF